MKHKLKALSFLLVLSMLITVSTAYAAVIAHDQVVGFAEVTPVTTAQIAAKTFQPTLKVTNGCVPFPAVDAQGNTSGGLSPSGGSSASCDSSTGQVYSRAAWYNGVYGIMYAWYMPKDSPSSGLGHRHDWEAAVIWIDNPAAANPQILSIAYSQHGDFLNAAPSSSNTSGTHAKLEYKSVWPVNHALYSTSESGGTQPLIDWDDLTSAARDALNTTDFGDANVPMKDSNFTSNLANAWYQ
ncbi:necrosis inducing protein (NPP1) [Paenibacillus cellulosilyticus]|uniref:Necrosis inducing protein (NPP1) n=1 Tax=Paenibacillus cellulosilyticus TaxID=375489 RepID=A0A2V2YLN2_9BACL|nr:NPP1 family protein [Paenibacillus cellulosilyticus]PWV94539.1 necrosis inducing protein (NPP1) [Paenibacillus cellulosilyticus]QKS45043.1 NPP1 family protein [Paenibacillus cellulosilyticus]